MNNWAPRKFGSKFRDASFGLLVALRLLWHFPLICWWCWLYHYWAAEKG